MAHYALRIDAARASIVRLIQQRIHQHTIGYLAVRYMLTAKPERVPAAFRSASDEAIEPGASDTEAVRSAVVNADIIAFFREFVAVPGYESRPYYRPFTDAQQPSLAHGWMNKNVSGSYAPKSMRNTGFGAVVERVGGTPGRPLLAFRAGYIDVVREQFAYGRPLPALDIAVYLYRDYAFEAEATPTAADLLAIFRHEFGFDGVAAQEYRTLFSESQEADAPLFEPLPLAANE